MDTRYEQYPSVLGGLMKVYLVAPKPTRTGDPLWETQSHKGERNRPLHSHINTPDRWNTERLHREAVGHDCVRLMPRFFLYSAPVAFRRVALETSEWTSRDSNHHRQSVSAGKTNAIPTEPSGRL